MAATWQSPKLLRRVREIATPVCALVRNDIYFSARYLDR